MPSFAPVLTKTTRQLATCATVCFVRDFLFGPDWRLIVPVYRIDLPSTSAPRWPRLVLQGAQSGQVQVISGASRITFTASSGSTVKNQVVIDLSGKLTPDDYMGALLLDTPGNPTPVSIPVEVQVKEGPWWPLVVLVLAILFGMGITWLLSKRAAVKFRNDARRMRTQIDALPAAERVILTPLWNRLWAERGANLTQAQNHLSALTNGAAALSECRDAQDDVLRSPAAKQLPGCHAATAA
jgi:hypothetical protein